jgi:hypothetical protein
MASYQNLLPRNESYGGTSLPIVPLVTDGVAQIIHGHQIQRDIMLLHNLHLQVGFCGPLITDGTGCRPI